MLRQIGAVITAVCRRQITLHLPHPVNKVKGEEISPAAYRSVIDHHSIPDHGQLAQGMTRGAAHTLAEASGAVLQLALEGAAHQFSGGPLEAGD
ncbi:hypothetical protein D3C75_871090 [compost metagenome]